MNLGQVIYVEDGQLRYHPTFLTSVLAIELLRVPIFAYLALKPPEYSQGPFHPTTRPKARRPKV